MKIIATVLVALTMLASAAPAFAAGSWSGRRDTVSTVNPYSRALPGVAVSVID